VRKIKRFKITLHHREIARRIARTGVELSSSGITGEREMIEFISGLAGEIEPGVLYETFDRSFTPLELHGIEPGNVFSAEAITLGARISEKIAALPEENLRLAAQTVAGEFLESAADFARTLIKDEADRENFELGGPVAISQPVFEKGLKIIPVKFSSDCINVPPATAEKVLPVLFASLSPDKIGISSDSGALTPFFSAVLILPWLNKKKTKKR